MTNTAANWLFWRNGQDHTAWGSECGRSIGRLFGHQWSGSDEKDAVRVVLDLPTADAARDAWNGNHDLIGMVTIAPCSPAIEPLKLSIPLPFDGVFIARRQDSDRPLSLIWGSWLGEALDFGLFDRRARQGEIRSNGGSGCRGVTSSVRRAACSRA